jgi:hypothetical protein
VSAPKTRGPVPRKNAEDRANSKAQDQQFIASVVNSEADPAAISMPTMLPRVLAALASVGRAFQ